MKNLKKQLVENFGYNQPFFIDEAKNLLPSFSEKYIYKLFVKLINNQDLVRYSAGVYYVPTSTQFGVYKISPLKVIERKYIKKNNEIFGIYSGMTLLKKYNLTTQVPIISEIITNKETNIKRLITLKDSKIILRRPSIIPITKNNSKYLEYLELANFADKNFLYNNADQFIEIFKKNKLNITKLQDYALQTEKTKAYNKLIKTGVINYVTS